MQNRSNGALDVVVSALPESMGPEAVDALLGEVRYIAWRCI